MLSKVKKAKLKKFKIIGSMMEFELSFEAFKDILLSYR